MMTASGDSARMESAVASVPSRMSTPSFRGLFFQPDSYRPEVLSASGLGVGGYLPSQDRLLFKQDYVVTALCGDSGGFQAPRPAADYYDLFLALGGLNDGKLCLLG